jgi:hypothetical protein
MVSLTIRSTPGGAEVLLDGKNLGRTPVTHQAKAGVPLIFVLSKEKYQGKHLKVTPTQDGEHAVTLAKKSRPKKSKRKRKRKKDMPENFSGKRGAN